MSRKSVEKSLLKQLSLKQADIDVFKDLVTDYLEMWEAKNAMQEEIAETGVTIDGIKVNPLVKELRDTNK